MIDWLKERFESDLRQRRTRNPQLASHLFILLAYFLLTIIMTWPVIAEFTTAIPGDGFDGWQNYWNLWWIKVALVDRMQSPLQTDLLYAPTGVGLYFHTLNPFNGITTLPVQLSFGLISAYNTVVFLSWPLAGYGVYLLVQWLLAPSGAQAHGNLLGAQPTTRKHTVDSPLPIPDSRPLTLLPSFIAGAIFTFSPFHMAHLLGHMQVMSLQWIPFYILYLLRTVQQNRQGRPWLRSALLAGVFLTLTGLCDWYFVLYLFFFTGIVICREVLILAAVSRHTRTYTQWLTIGIPATVAGTVMILLLSPMLIPMVREATQFSFMVRPTTDLYTLSASVMDFLIPNRLHALWRPESFTWIGNQIAPVSERTSGIGYVALLLTVVALLLRVRQSLFWGVTALFFLMLALGPTWHWGYITNADIPAPGTINATWTPFAILNEIIPFMRISRSVSRYALMVQISAAVLAGLGMAVLFRWLALRRSTVVTTQYRQLLLAIGLCVLILFEYWVVPFPTSPPDTPAFYYELRAMEESGTVLNLPMNYDRPGYLLYQTIHQQPLAIAYISRDDPRTLTERVPLLQHFRHLGPDIIDLDPVVVGETVLNDLGIGIVVQDRYKMPGGLERDYTESLTNKVFADQIPLYTDERITVHRVQPPASPQPYLMLGALHWGPLTTREGRPVRALAKQPAALHFVHVSSQMQVQLHYQTLPEITLTIGQGDGTKLQTLPPAPAGTVVTIPLHELGIIADQGTILLAASGETGVWIEQIGLLTQ